MIRHVQKITTKLPSFSTLLLAEHNGKGVSKNTLKLLSAAQKFGQDVRSPIYVDPPARCWLWSQGSL